MKEYTQAEIDGMTAAIDTMTQYEMARRWRFSESGDPYFRSDLPLYEKFAKRFNELGGMTPELSKRLGWEK